MMQTFKTLGARWETMAPREQTGVVVAVLVVLLALVYWLGIAPAVATLRASGPRQQQLDRQLQSMQALQARAQAAKAQPLPPGADAVQLLRESIRPLGEAAQLAITAEGATLTLRDVGAEQLATWLSQTRSQARAVPVHARLVRSDPPAMPAPSASPAPGSPGAASAAPRWSGTVVLSLPPS